MDDDGDVELNLFCAVPHLCRNAELIKIWFAYSFVCWVRFGLVGVYLMLFQKSIWKSIFDVAIGFCMISKKANKSHTHTIQRKLCKWEFTNMITSTDWLRERKWKWKCVSNSTKFESYAFIQQDVNHSEIKSIMNFEFAVKSLPTRLVCRTIAEGYRFEIQVSISTLGSLCVCLSFANITAAAAVSIAKHVTRAQRSNQTQPIRFADHAATYFIRM